VIGDSEMQISLAKPPTENKQKEMRKQMQKLQFVRRSVTWWFVKSPDNLLMMRDVHV